MGGGDGAMAALGAGVIGPDSGGYAYLGSSSWVSFAADEPLHDPSMRTMTFNHVVPGRFVPTATMQAGGASLQWVSDVLAPSDEHGLPGLLAEAAVVEASADGLYFLPHLLGERSPYWNPRARAVFAGLAMHHGRAHLVRAVLEGVAFNLATGLQAFAEVGASLGAMSAIGGAARSPALLGVLADVWGVPVAALELAEEATSLGAAVVGGVGVGLFPDFTVVERFGRRAPAAVPDDERHARYRRAHRTFSDAYDRLEGWFETL
jgi:xylulokinase